MSSTDTNQASEDELREQLADKLEWYSRYRERDQDDDMDRAFDDILALIRTEKLKLLAEVRVRVVGEDEKLVIPDYPKTDDEGEPLYSKRAAKEGRKQVTARYHTRKELRNDQRTELDKLKGEL